LVDEDLASRALVHRLAEALGDDLIQPEYGAIVDEVWQRAQAEQAAILAGNVVDFLLLATAQPDHFGLLLVYRSNDRQKDLRAADIARGVLAIGRAHPSGISSLVLAVNDYARPA
jgi:hypothetical protein